MPKQPTTVYSPPTSVGKVPDLFSMKNPNGHLDFTAYEKAEREYVERIKEYARKNGSGKAKGKEVSFGVADGKAVYIIFSTRPSVIIHVPIGDAWNYHMVDRLTGKELAAQADAEEKLDALFAGNAGK